MNEESIFAAALQKKNPAEREAYLSEACGTDMALLERVKVLLRAHVEAGGFLEKPAAPPEATGDYISEADSGPPPTGRVTEGPGTVIGPYKLLQQLGQGGMGAVYMAEQEHPVRRRVALKVIKAGMDSAQVIARFEQERQALAMMDHPNIAKVLDAGATASGRPFFVMELVKGIPITKFCDQEHLTPRERLDLFIPVCQAVQHAHQKGIIHRDLKPSNVLIALYDGRPVPKVIDFGVAKATAQRLTERTMFTEVGQIVGTLEYMAPEQAELNNLDIDTRADIYSLGVILYELLTGSPPFTSKQLRSAAFTEMLRMIREVEPPKPSTKLSSSAELPSIAANRKLEPKKLTKLVHGDLDWIVMKCLAKERGRRYETANGLALDIERYLHEEPVLAGPPGAGYRLRKLARKYRTVLVTSVAFVALLAAGVVLSTWQAVRATVAEREARAAGHQAQEERNRALQAEAEAKEQRDRALAAEKEAWESEADTRAFSQFLVEDVLSVARPEGLMGGLGIDVTVRRALDEAAKKVEERFRGRPRAEAVARHDLGLTYGQLGEEVLAEPHARRAVELRQQTSGPHHPDTLSSMNSLAFRYYNAGRLDEALPLFEETLKLRKIKVGPDHPDTLQSMNNLALAYRQVGRTQEAVALHQETLKLRQAKLGPDHPDTLQSMSNLAFAYRQAGRRAEALALAAKALQLRKDKLGPDHPSTLNGMYVLAGMYQAMGRLTAASLLYEETLKLARVKFGADHPNTLGTMNNLALAYQAAGRLAEALSLFEDTVKLAKTKLGPDHHNTLRSMNGLALVYQNQGNFDRAEALFLEVLAHQKRKLGAEHPDAARTLAFLGQNYLKQQQYAEAEPHLRESEAIYKKKVPDDWRHYHTQSLLGGALLGQQQYAAAEPLLLAGYQGLKQRVATIPAEDKVRLTDALERLVQLYAAWGKKEGAAKWRQELDERKRSAKEPK
jgi:serine/threonine protein kinase